MRAITKYLDRAFQNYVDSRYFEAKTKFERLLYYPVRLPAFLNRELHSNNIALINGIPHVRYHFGVRYNPVTVSLHALLAWELRKMKYFMYLVENLLQNTSKTEIGHVLYYKFAFPPCSSKPQWMSGMAQGLAVSTMLRAFCLTGETSFLEHAESYAKAMLTRVEEGGSLHVNEMGVWIEECPPVWIEESPSERAPKHILNGFIYSTIGLYELTLFDRKHLHVLSQVLHTLEDNYKIYDLGVWSKYDIRKPANPFYHLLNTTLTYIVAKLSGSTRLMKLSRRWMIGFMLGSDFVRSLRPLKRFVPFNR